METKNKDGIIQTSDGQTWPLWIVEGIKRMLRRNGLNPDPMTPDELFSHSRKLSCRSDHEWDRPYRGHGTRICRKCGSEQTN